MPAGWAKLARLLRSAAIRLISPAIVLAVICTTPLAAAQGTSAVERFRDLVEAATEDYSAGRYEAALQKLRQARAIRDHPGVAYNIARTLYRLEQCREARSAFEQYASREDIRDADVAAARQQLEELKSCKEEGTITVECNVEGEVVLSDSTVLQCNTTTAIDEGEYVASFQGDGYEDERRSFRIDPDETTTVSFDVRLSEPPETPGSDGGEGREDRQRTWGWALVGSGAAIALTGLAVAEWPGGVIRLNAARRAADRGDLNRVDRIDRFGATTVRPLEITALATGIVVAGTGGLLLAIEPGDTEEPASVSLRGRF